MIADVVVPFRVASSFHYKINEEDAASLTPGSVVEVNFAGRPTHAFVLGLQEHTDVPVEKLKTINSVLVREPVLDEKMLKFLRWVSEYYCHPLGEVLAVAFPKISWQRSTKKRKTAPKAVISDFIGDGKTEKPTLTDEQRQVLDAIVGSADNRPILLHGITGSGKTEVYMSVLESVVEKGQSGIVLVPEIALTPQLLHRFSNRFPGQVALIHSELTPSERASEWERIRTKQAKVVVGARSAIFAPVHELGLIVVDEEHEPSFKQEDSLRYHARDLAVVRGHMEGAKVILGSATPSLESYSNALQGKYLKLELTKRVEDRELPKTLFVDLRERANLYRPEIPWLSRHLANRIAATTAAGQQALLFLNRLGFAHFLFCKDCGHTWHCPDCDVSLTYYRSPLQLRCHYCGYERVVPKQCSECQGTNLEVMGLGTEQVETQLKELFPNARVGRMDRSVIKTRKDLEGILKSIAKGELDIIVGTQMVAKGHDFPGIALVGILVADASLNMPDFRANERTFQIITQVSGRAGRGKHPGEVVIQTMSPDQPVLKWAAENKSGDFYAAEMMGREQFGFPPFQRMAVVRFQHTNPGKVQRFAEGCVDLLKRMAGNDPKRMSVLGPSEAPIARVKKMYRWQCVVKSSSVRDLQKVLKNFQAFYQAQKSVVQVAVDVDPMSIM